ncbi:MAG: hypothetical protein KME60_28435 [Cyanomargarita calcarea GSE-NOS-MK-12-04C]|jgi:ElaB/YqjD/DUF883 family membrane-anchored ribosome-binding protein|uniref:Pentapeptide repeat-containing protein n=1 Tax=Cyanomargarita calcarea GSE-NOS-MK-12-04C TaxID=2839659 RepID=A0A951QRS2_9CYAN|nr:hypothetical protein [Cyanomargarita calcarea GSE-NOS-MK-12-04C]
MSEVNNNFSGANFTGITNFDGTHYANQTGILHNYAPEQNLADAAKEIQDLLAQLQLTNPTVTEAQKQAAMVKKVEQHIKQNPTIRDRLLNALKQGGIETLKQALDTIYKNPFVSISVETVKGFLEAEYA